jgi:acetylornithine deacetylase
VEHEPNVERSPPLRSPGVSLPSGPSATVESILAKLAVLVGFPTVSGTPNVALLEWLAEQLIGLGAAAEILPGRVDGCGNLVARFGPDAPGGIVLSGHTDVVPAGDGWSSDPWTATVVGDVVRGRGTADMKGFFAALIDALGRFDPTALERPVHIVASYDEEVGCRGVRDVLDTLSTRVDTPSLVIVGEPTMMLPRRASPGKRVYRVVVRCAEAHSSRAAELPGAITEAARLVLAIERLNGSTAADPSGVRPFTLNVGTVDGGRQVNVVADCCAVEFEIRTHASGDPDEVLAPLWVEVDDIRQRVRDVGGDVEVTELVAYPSLATSADDPALGVIERLADGGGAGVVGFGTEGGLLAETLDAPVVICGPGDIANAHCADEFVAISQLVRCADLITAVVDGQCGAGAAHAMIGR